MVVVSGALELSMTSEILRFVGSVVEVVAAAALVLVVANRCCLRRSFLLRLALHGCLACLTGAGCEAAMIRESFLR